LPLPACEHARPSQRLDPSGLTDTAQPFYKLAPAWVGHPFRPGALAPAARGYAAAGSGLGDALHAGPAAASVRPRPAPAPARQRASGELAFLDDKSLSIQDKLFRFMALMLRKSDEELIEKMKEYEAKKKAQEAKEEGGGGFFDCIGDVLGGIGDIGHRRRGVPGEGPRRTWVLAAILHGRWLPQLAPIAMKRQVTSRRSRSRPSAAFRLPTQAALGVARQLENAAQGQGTSSRESAQSGSTSAEGFDERLEMLKLQRLVDKQNTMFSALSNVLKSMHDAQMTAVGNIR
jgi:hypothetical protein